MAKNVISITLAMSKKSLDTITRMVTEMRNNPSAIRRYVNTAAHVSGRKGDHARRALSALTAAELEAAIPGVYAAADVAIRDYALQVNAARQKELAVVEKLLASKESESKAGFFTAF